MTAPDYCVRGLRGRVSSALVIAFLLTPRLLPAQGGTWKTKALMPTPRIQFAAAVSDGIVYAIGGVAGSSFLTSPIVSTVDAFDPATNAWSHTAPMSTVRNGPAAAAVDGVLYVVGGLGYSNPAMLSSMEAYDPKTNAWTSRSPMPTRRWGASAAVVNGIIYVIGGDAPLRPVGDDTVTTVEAYDPKTDTWTTKAPMPTPRQGMAVGVMDGIIYVAGGYVVARISGIGGFVATLEAYDPRTNTWATKAPMPIARSEAAAGVLAGRLFVAGGQIPFATTSVTGIVQAYDPNSNAWSTYTPIPTPRGGLAGGVVNGVFYALGGFTGNYPTQMLATNEALTPNSPPIANAGPNQTVECAGRSGSMVTLNGSGSSDPDGDSLTFTWKDEHGNVVGSAAIVNVTVPLGAHPFTLTVDDGHGNQASAGVTITVRDTIPPTISLTLTPNVLWPADHKMIPITTSIQINDICDPNPRDVLLSIVSNEPDNGTGDGHTSNDIQGAVFATDDRSFLLRAERSATGKGRVYTVTYRATDASGNSSNASATVIVPLDQAKQK